MHVYLRGSGQQRLRLVSGFILFAFATAHFLNHALGLVSLEAMHQMQQWRTFVTRSTPGTIVLLAALVAHIGLGLYKLAKRETWRMPRWEAVQIGLGLAIPFLLFPHIINTRIAHVFFNVEDSYLYELVRLWPDSAVIQISLLLFVWTHGCLGLHYWLRLSDSYVVLAPILLVLALAVPILAIAGFATGGQITGDIMSDAQALAELKARSNWPNAEDSATLAWLRTGSRIAFLLLVAGVVGIFLLRRTGALVRKAVRITYADGPSVDLVPGKTLLELSRSAGIPHASVCGGRGRCSTCRVRVEKGLEKLPAPAGAEAMTLRSIEAPPNVRLACQIRPTTPLTVAIVSHPGTPGPPQEDFSEIKAIVGAHVRAVMADQLVEMQSSDPAVLAKWLAEKVTYPVAVSDLSTRGFSLQGVRMEYLLERPAPALVYVRNQRPITLFARETGDSGSLAMRGQRNGYHVLAWEAGSLTWIAVSDLPYRDLDRLEEALRAPEPVLRTGVSTAVG